MFDKPNDGYSQKYRHRHHRCHRDVRCGRKGHRQQPQKVGAYNKHKERHDVGKITNRVFSSDILNHFIDEPVGQFTD